MNLPYRDLSGCDPVCFKRYVAYERTWNEEEFVQPDPPRKPDGKAPMSPFAKELFNIASKKPLP